MSAVYPLIVVCVIALLFSAVLPDRFDYHSFVTTVLVIYLFLDRWDRNQKCR